MNDELHAPEVSDGVDLDAFVMWNAQQLAFPPSEWEENTLAEVLVLPRVVVTRPPKQELLDADMVPHDCHANCAAQAANDPSRRSRHVWGWLVNGSDLILHSVVDIGGRWICLTPQHREGSTTFTFIPDMTIEWRDSGQGRDAFRRGVQVPQALRSHPARHIQMWEHFRNLVASGVPVAEARQIVDDTLGLELRRMKPLG